MNVATVPDGFAIATPGDWLVFDMEALQQQSEIEAFLDARQAQISDLAQHRQELCTVLVSAGEQAREAGVLFAGALATAREEDGAPVVASVSVATLDRSLNESVIAEAAQTLPKPAVGAEERTVGTGLPAGYAARIERVTEVPLLANTQLMTLTVQYLLEVPGSDCELLALTFVTPAMAYRDRLTNLFENVARTFEWTYSAA